MIRTIIGNSRVTERVCSRKLCDAKRQTDEMMDSIAPGK